MYDSGKIIFGLVIFLILATFPFWYNVVDGKPNVQPELKYVTDAKQCVRDTDWMKENHMHLLNQWRDDVVRKGERYFKGPEGKVWEMSLSNTCMNCHSNKADFCDQCHNYMDVDPYCWSCHIAPEEQ
jgi:hypothetical protein